MNNIRSARKKVKLTLKELGKMVGVSESTMSNYETGKREPDFDTLRKFSEILEVSIDYLLGITDDPTPPSVDRTEAEAWEIRERLRRDPSYRLLFDAADKASPDHLKAAAAMLKALEGNEEEN